MADRIARATQSPQEAAKVATDKQKGTVTVDLEVGLVPVLGDDVEMTVLVVKGHHHP
ncbi:hypothetical protein [Streptomyces sp. NBC_01445]|uniref:hypothetical protein n=1 Tax=Streptomyces sp. NBC_01445 TaxID=2903869 RepID=UPI002DDABD3C|nr:hypothetical protein [Streptomyces sp. NBC_01445]